MFCTTTIPGGTHVSCYSAEASLSELGAAFGNRNLALLNLLGESILTPDHFRLQ
jgi:hypothetical protein